jgi:hypothetical protein
MVDRHMYFNVGSMPTKTSFPTMHGSHRTESGTKRK